MWADRGTLRFDLDALGNDGKHDTASTIVNNLVDRLVADLLKTGGKIVIEKTERVISVETLAWEDEE